MDLSHRLAVSYYKTITTINEPHHIYLVQHTETKKLYIKKILDVYNIAVYEYLYKNPIMGIPRIIEYLEEKPEMAENVARIKAYLAVNGGKA